MYTSKIVAILALCASALAADVYSDFEDKDGNSLSDTHFDIGNPGCFSIGPAYRVQFSQAGGDFTKKADGPYCLSAWTDAGCNGSPQGQQGFSDVVFVDTYELNSNTQAVGSYMWATNACP